MTGVLGYHSTTNEKHENQDSNWIRRLFDAFFLSTFNIYDRVLSIIAQDSLPERISEQSSSPIYYITKHNSIVA